MTTTRARRVVHTFRVLAICSAVILMQGWASVANADEEKAAIDRLDQKAPGANLTRGEAMQTALKTLPGKVTDITVERKRGKQVYVIEVVADNGGGENDVLVDMQTGQVLGVEK
jgi:uncharacterized membrane protein YkoI